MATDEWVRAAMTDDMVVAELLARLKQSQVAKCAAGFPLKWGMRQPRTRPTMRCDGAERRREGDSSSASRCSPTTPLSWSRGGGEASPSGTADGLEETSLHNGRSSSGPRSKITSTYEATSITPKRSRKKKTFSELKEEENSLLKERMHLTKELAALQATFKKQRATNENLKRIKLDLGFQPAKKLNSICTEQENHPPSHSSEPHKDVSIQDRSFLLPDLNMVPVDEDSTSEALH